jgi:hypothetical protein
MHLRRLFQVLVLGGTALVAGACGGDSGAGPAPQQQILPDGGVVMLPGGAGGSGGGGGGGMGDPGGPPGW